MTGIMVTQRGELRAEDIGLIRDILAEHGHWGRTRLSEEPCRRWGRRNAQGSFKDMAARSLITRKWVSACSTGPGVSSVTRKPRRSRVVPTENPVILEIQ